MRRGIGWRRIFLIGGARAYVGTLFPVTTSEAQEVIIKLLDKHSGKPLAAALWSAQREVYGIGLRRPYIATGVYPQRLRVKRRDVVGRMVSRLSGTLAAWKKTLSGIDPNDSAKTKIVRENVAYYEQELAHFQKLTRT